MKVKKVASPSLNAKGWFDQRNAVLVSMHGKEKVIAPLLKEHFNINLVVSSFIDTDLLGTFTGDVERPDTQFNTLRLKIEQGVKKYQDETLFIASEGSFNPHPEVPFVTVNTEMVMLYDKKNEWESTGCFSSFESNMDRQEVTELREGIKFAMKNKFPSHGMIISPVGVERKKSFMGIVSPDELGKAIVYCLALSPVRRAKIETDMRAFCNPTRMKNIGEATADLIRKLNRQCPACQVPGFDIQEVLRGLPCAQCGYATKLTHTHIYQCKKCHHRQEKMFPDSEEADPMYCDFCNP